MKDCKDCYKKDTPECEPKKYKVGSYEGCHNRVIHLAQTEKTDTRTPEQKEKDRKEAEFYNNLNYCGD